MITQTFDVALTRFKFLRSKIDEVVTVDMMKTLRSYWINYRARQNPYFDRVSIAGIDSGFNYIEYRGYALYAMNTVTVIVNGDEPEHVEGFADIDVVSTHNLEHELSILSICSEVQAMAKAMERSDIVLVDGSLIAMFSKLYKASMENGLDVLDSKGINTSEVLRSLVYMVVLSPRKFVFISKNSNSKDLLGFVKGDIYYLERYTGFTSGYTRPLDLLYSKHIGVSTVVRLFKRYVRNLTGLDSSIALVYIRFKDFANVYRVEMVVEPGEDVEDRVRRIVDLLFGVNISGYPYPLIRAHNLAKIGNQDMERIAVLLGIASDPRNREAFLM